MNGSAVGILELTSIAAGFAAADAMLKAGDVELLLSRSICSGKFMIVIGGGPASVPAALASGAAAAEGCVIDQVVVSHLHPEVLAAVGRCQPEPTHGALGIVESFNVATLIEAADAAVKSAEVHLHELRLAMALGGKAFVLLRGDVASVQTAVDAARLVLSRDGMLVHAVVLARPHPDVCREWV